MIDISIIDAKSDRTIKQKRLEIAMPYALINMPDDKP